MKTLFFALFTLVSASAVMAQTTVEVDTTGQVPTVTVSDDSFEAMCQSLKIMHDDENKSGIITFRPKVMLYGQDDKSGSVWVLSTMGKRVEISQTKLAPKLQKLRGAVVRNVLQASCYTEDMMFFTRRSVVILTASVEDANAVASALR